MIASVHRRVGIATTAALIVGLLAVTPASAYVAPMEPGSQCQSVAAGYWATSGTTYGWNGLLTWNLCVNRTGSGTGAHYASVQLSAPSWLGYNKFWGRVPIYLQSCTAGYQTVAYKEWLVEGIAQGTLSNGRYWWARQTTPTTSSYMAGSFRVLVGAYATVQGSNYRTIALMPGPVGSPTWGSYASACMAP